MNYPEHNKLNKVNKYSQQIGEFLDWASDNGYALCSIDDERVGRYSINNTITTARQTKLLAEFYDIDLNKIEEEKEQMINSLRRQNGHKAS